MKSRDQVKAELVQRFEVAVERVLDWQEAHPRFTLKEVEDFVLALRREMGEEITGLLMQQLDSELMLGGLHCERCGSKLEYKGRSAKQTTCRVGEIDLERGRYWCPRCETGFFPPG